MKPNEAADLFGTIIVIMMTVAMIHWAFTKPFNAVIVATALYLYSKAVVWK